MKFNEIRPYVLNVTPRRYMSDQKKAGQMLHWVILYIDAGQGEIRLNNRRAEPLGAGSAVMFQPGTSYSLRVTGDEMTGSMIEFDLAPELTCEQAAALRIDDMPRLNEPFVVSDVAALKASMDEALTIFMRHEPMWEMSVAARCVEAITVMARATNSRMHYLVNQVITLISERYNQAVGNSDIARELGKHPNYINAVFVRDMGMSIHQYVMRYRIEKAEHLLLTTQMPISEVAREVGFRHFSHFSNCFHKMTGYTPANYRMER